MPRLMSVSLTEQAVRDRRKTVTRRLGWHTLEPGMELDLCRKVMGRKRPDGTVEPLVRIARVRVLDTRWEPLSAVTDTDVEREGFWYADLEPYATGSTSVYSEDSMALRFVGFFCESMRCMPSTLVNRIEWEYLPTPTDWPAPC